MVLNAIFSKPKRTSGVKRNISDITKLKLDAAHRIVSYRISEQLRDLCFDKTKCDEEGFIEYVNGLKIKDLSNYILEKEGISIFKVKSTKNITIDLHDHKNQSQTIMVQTGKLTILDSNLEIFQNESFFIKKNKPHKIMYLENTEAIIIYLPNLERIDK